MPTFILRESAARTKFSPGKLSIRACRAGFYGRNTNELSTGNLLRLAALDVAVAVCVMAQADLLRNI
jgi:hypothetical protein